MGRKGILQWRRIKTRNQPPYTGYSLTIRCLLESQNPTFSCLRLGKGWVVSECLESDLRLGLKWL